MSSILKNSRKIFTGVGGDPSLSSRVTTLENNEYKITYYEIISGTSGSITIPTGATINAGEFGLSGNAILSKIDGSNKPTFESPLTVSGTIVTASLNVSNGAWLTSGIYTDINVALIYSIKIKAIDYINLTYNNIVGDPEEIDTEKILNKSNSYTTSSTATYPNTKALVDGLATKGTSYTHVATAGANLADSTIYFFGQETLGSTTFGNISVPKIRSKGINKTGVIKNVVVSFFVSNSTLASTEPSNIYLRNHTTNTNHLLGTILFRDALNSSFAQVLTGLNIPVTIEDGCSTVIQTPEFATNPTGTYIHVDYIIK